MSSLSSVKLNQGQQAAADAFFAFLFSNDKEMIISGPAGTGKTFLMGKIIDDVMPNYFNTCKLMGIPPEYDGVTMTATTNKAADVLSQAMGRPASTVHSFLNLTVREDYSTGRSTLTKTRQWTVHRKLILFVDECSMVDHALRELILEGTHSCKIVYVGDHCQIGPIMETISPIYKLGLPFYELTEPMRNAEQPALMAISQQLRNTVETGIFNPIKLTPGVIDWVDDTQMAHLVEQTFKNHTRTNRILTYTNRRVIEYNDHIRALRGLPNEYQVGEILVNNQAFRHKGDMLSVEEEVEILSQSKTTHKKWIDTADDGIEVTLEVRESDLKNTINMGYSQVLVPVDRDHYSNLLNYYAKRKEWSTLFRIKQLAPDLRPRDAATVHKAQGSTYETVFIDLGNLSLCHNPVLAAKLLYVAFTRAKNRVVLYGELAEKYGTLVT